MAGLALREVVTAGEQLRITPAIAALFTRLPECRLYNQYGPTEATVDVSCWDCRPGERRGYLPLGAPVTDTQLYALSEVRRLSGPVV